jgi:probable HAF family extracellular repeat protein
MRKTLLAGSLAAVLIAGTAHAAPRYDVTHLSPPGFGSSINNRGWVAGATGVLDNRFLHATLWRNGMPADLGTLGGPERNSAVIFPVKNVRGIVTGISQTAEPDPFEENWSCSAFFPEATATGYRCLGFKWEDGVMEPLPTLGGTHGFAAGANNRGQIAGWAENTVRDPSCDAPQIFQFRAVVWGPRDGQIRALEPFSDDTTSAATALNDRGQVVGISGECDQAVGRFSAKHAVLWEDGEVKDLGNLGGVAWHTPTAINERGDIAGFGNFDPADGGRLRERAFVRRAGKRIRRLDPLPGHDTSQALGINARGEVVGQSCDAQRVCRAVLWRHRRPIDLTTRVAPGYTGRLVSAGDIDDLGRITGQAFDALTGRLVAFVARPRR